MFLLLDTGASLTGISIRYLINLHAKQDGDNRKNVDFRWELFVTMVTSKFVSLLATRARKTTKKRISDYVYIEQHSLELTYNI